LTLVGTTIPNPGKDQERNRGAELHKAVSARIGSAPFGDTGQFPDVFDQLLEVKLQTSSTIDLGLISPDSTEPLADLPGFHHYDVRYSVFYGSIEGANVRLEKLVLSVGSDFFSFFQRFEGNVSNEKRQIRLPRDFFAQAESLPDQGVDSGL